jgi:hypothetical protein
MATATSSNKKATPAEKDLCRLITPKFRVSYPHVFKPQAPKPGDKLKYSITMLFDKSTDLMGVAPGPEAKPRSLQAVIRNAKVLEFGPNKETWPEELISPVTDGDDPKFADKDGYKGHWVIKATTNEDQRPSVVDADMNPITEPSELYPGCYARAYVYAYVWEYMGKQGVGFILDHVQKLGDGKSFGGKKPIEQVFGRMDAGDEGAEDVSEDFR